jgi:hypothetical protein
MNREYATARMTTNSGRYSHRLPASLDRINGHDLASVPRVVMPTDAAGQDQVGQPAPGAAAREHADATAATAMDESLLLQDAAVIYETAAARGERLSQRALARTLRSRGHRFPNQSLRGIALSVGLVTAPGHLPAANG